MALIEVSTHPGSLPPTSAGQDLFVSSSEPLATDNSSNDPTSLASIEMEDLQADPVNSAPQNTPGNPVSKQTLWSWLKHTEVKSSPLTLVMTLLALIVAVVFGTSTWIQSSTSAEATAKANRLALFTACVSFPDQPNIVNSTFCQANRNASLDGFAKRGTAAISPPILWDMDVFAEALQIIQPAWQCRAVCGQEMVLHPSGSTLVLSFPMLTGKNCHLDCFEPTQTTFWAKKIFQSRFKALLAVVSFTIIILFSRKYLARSTLNGIVTFITYMCLILCIASFVSERHHISHQRAQFAYQVINKTGSKSNIGVTTPSLFYRLFSLGSKAPVWLKMASWILSVFNILERGLFAIDTALLLFTHIIDLDLQYLLCLFCFRVCCRFIKGQRFRFPGQSIYPVLWTFLYIGCGIMCGLAPLIISLDVFIRGIDALIRGLSKFGYRICVLVFRVLCVLVPMVWKVALNKWPKGIWRRINDQMNTLKLKFKPNKLDYHAWDQRGTDRLLI